ncbi:hypothetical protein B0H17DRAFT_1058836, partial [Mycena rosella]
MSCASASGGGYVESFILLLAGRALIQALRRRSGATWASGSGARELMTPDLVFLALPPLPVPKFSLRNIKLTISNCRDAFIDGRHGGKRLCDKYRRLPQDGGENWVSWAREDEETFQRKNQVIFQPVRLQGLWCTPYSIRSQSGQDRPRYSHTLATPSFTRCQSPTERSLSAAVRRLSETETCSRANFRVCAVEHRNKSSPSVVLGPSRRVLCFTSRCEAVCG